MWILFFSQHWSPVQNKSKNILDASVLQFYDEFLGIIGYEPSGKYKDCSHHNFHQNIISILFEQNISDETFEKRNKEVIDGFNDKNCLGINIEKIGKICAKLYVDSRCVISVMYEQGYAIGKIINTTQIASKEIQEMSTTMGAMGNNLHNAKK